MHRILATATAGLALALGACLPGGSQAPRVAIAPEDTATTPPPARPIDERTPEHSAWVERAVRSLSLREKAGQMIVAWTGGGYLARDSRQFEELRRWVEDDGVGGLILSIGTPHSYAARLNLLQRRARVPLLVMTDMESGPGMRLNGSSALGGAMPHGGGTDIPPVMALGAAGSDSLAFEVGRVIALEARAVGLTLNLSPVLDVNSNPANPIINTRSFGEDPQAVARLASAYLRGLHAGGLLASGKHFPGHGDTQTDSHMDLAVVGGTRARLDSVELVPFRAAVAAGIDAVLVGHIAVPALEGGGSPPPASLSPAIVTRLLREEMGFRGLVLTDAMNMGALTRRYGQDEAAVRAVEAGADLLLQPLEPGAAVRALVRAVESGRIPESRLDASVRRILAAKERAGLARGGLVRVDQVDRAVGPEAHARLAEQVARRSLVLARDRRGLVPLAAGRRVLSVTYTDAGGSLAGREFDRVLAAGGLDVASARVDERTSAADFAALAARADSADLVVVSAYVQPREYRGSVEAGGGFAGFVERLAGRGAPVVAVSFGSPYVVRAFPSVPAYLLAWGGVEVSQRAAAEALLGAVPITGTLPVTVLPDLPRGTGIARPARGPEARP